MSIEVKNANDLVGTLKNKTVVDAKLEDNTLTLKFNDGSILKASACSGSGLDSNWYDWTLITLNGETILDK